MLALFLSYRAGLFGPERQEDVAARVEVMLAIAHKFEQIGGCWEIDGTTRRSAGGGRGSLMTEQATKASFGLMGHLNSVVTGQSCYGRTSTLKTSLLPLHLFLKS
jgi:hypothetical protein